MWGRRRLSESWLLRIGWGEMRRFLRRLALSSMFAATALLGRAEVGHAQAQDFAPFFVLNDLPNVIVLDGEIDFRTPLAFRRALTANPQAHTVVLNSGGGSVQAGLLVAEEVYDRGMNTIILPDFQCLSACSFVFLAGQARIAEGKLGVHQMSGSDDIEAAQLNLSDVLETLAKYGVSQEVITRMLRTKAEDMYVFTPQEVASLGITRAGKDSAQVAPSLPQAPSMVPSQPSSQQDEAKAKAFVLGLILSGSLPTNDLIQLSQNAYAESVQFYGKQITRREVLADKKQYADRWPVRVSSARPNTIRTSCNVATCRVTGIYDWQVSNPSTKKRLSGVASFDYTVDMRGSGYRVVAEEGNVIERHSR